MANIPYTFAGDTGNIPLSYLDVNFSNVKQKSETAGYVTESNQPTITSVGALTSLLVTGNITGANLNGTIGTAAQPGITSVGNLTALIVTGNITGGNIGTAGTVTGTSVKSSGTISATGTITGGNLSVGNGTVTSGNISVTGTTTTNSLTVNNDAAVNGNIVIYGNASILGTTTTTSSSTLTVSNLVITVANNVSNSSAINGAGINAGNPTVAYIHYSDTSKGWTTANNFSIGGNLTVTDGGTFGGAVTATTAANGTSNTQLATTAFVSAAITNGVGTLGTMASQNANAVTITGGTIAAANVALVGTNSQGNRTVSTSVPSGGSNGDVWFQI